MTGAPPPKSTLSVSRSEIDSRDPTLRILHDGGKPYTIILAQRTLNLGSEARQDIPLDAPGIAPRHARFIQEGTAYRVFDLTGIGGVLVNNQPFDGSVLLRDGDVIRLQDRTGYGATLTYSNPVERALGSESVGKLVDLNISPFNIGRNPGSHLHLNSLAVSWQHATIEAQGSGHILRDGGSTNGTYVNDKRVTGTHRLQLDDVIRIDQFLLVYKGKALQRMASSQKIEIDAYNLEMTYKTGFLGRKKLNTMRDVNLAIQPREFVAVIGGSGSGKSTLLKMLNGAYQASSGKVLVNGEDLYEKYEIYQPIIGYVPQLDIVNDALTVYQTLYFGAKLRFPNEPDAAREERIKKVLADVELTDFKERFVGRLSGGQRKRVSIALELMADPALLFMDEPSSGLDPGLDESLMQTLRKLADRGTIVIVVTHTTLNIKLCDQLAVMARGHLAYFGPPQAALDFFGVRDYPELYNKVQITPEAAEERESETMLFSPQSSRMATPEQITPQESARRWAERYKHTPQFAKYVEERLRVHGQSLKDSVLTNRKMRFARRGSFWQQARTLTERTIALVRRDVRTIISLLLVLPLVGLFLGLISFDPIERSRGLMLVSRGTNADYLLLMDKLVLAPVASVAPAQTGEATASNATPESSSAGARQQGPSVKGVGTFVPAADAERVLFILALAVTLFGVFASAYTIVVEKPLFLRERMVNLRINAYLASKVVVYSALAMFSCVLALLMLSVGVNLPNQGLITWGPFEMFITMALAALAGVSMGFLISALNRQVNAVTYLVLGVLFFQILFAGLLFKMDGALEPVSRLTVTRWALEALGGTSNMVQRNAEGRIVVETAVTNPKTGKELVGAPPARQYFPAPPNLSVTYPIDASGLLVRWGALLAFTVVFLAATSLALRRDEKF